MTYGGAEARSRYDFLFSRSAHDDGYGLWRVDIDGDILLQQAPLDPNAKFDHTHQLVAIGRYLLEWGPLTLAAYKPCYPYRLFEFDPASKDPLAAKPVQHGIWAKTKFWSSRVDFGNPYGANKAYASGDELLLIPLGSFVLNIIPTEGRGTYHLWNFDPNPLARGQSDPLPEPYTPQGAFDSIQAGNELLPIGNYVLDRIPETGDYKLWSFDPQNAVPLAQPTVQKGRWKDIDVSHKLVVIGDHILDWVPADRSYRLWRFDPKCGNPLTGPVRTGELPEAFDAQTTLTCAQPLLPIDDARKNTPGTIDFMRSKIKHVVYYMVENRSFDHVCGWLYENDEANIHFVGRDGPFEGARPDMYNIDPSKTGDDKKVFVSKYEDGKLSEDWVLDFLKDDPYHDKSDVMRQLFYDDRDGYSERATPRMGGFVWNNGATDVMQTYAPEQLPVLDGLAKHFAVSDAWFSSMPGATDSNRAFAFTGSALGQLNNFQNGDEYLYWPETPRRASIWKTLWSNGFTDWKIYNSVEWMGFVHSYHLFLQGQIPAVDANKTKFIADNAQFKKDAAAGSLPAFSFLEPVWIGEDGTSSYHPGADLVPGERALNEIYTALKAGPAWDETLLIITFDEHGGLYDHVPPPYAENPWPNDVTDGFRFDLMGVRVPTILVSPWVKKHTVFRSPTPVAYDSTSFLATLLDWYGVPKSRWCLGERVHNAPTFEGVFQSDAPRRDAPALSPPFDKLFPREGVSTQSPQLHDLHRLIAPRLIAMLAHGKLSVEETARITKDIMARAADLRSLHGLISDLDKRLN